MRRQDTARRYLESFADPKSGCSRPPNTSITSEPLAGVARCTHGTCTTLYSLCEAAYNTLE